MMSNRMLRSGVDLSGGKPPSMIQMFRLTANPTLREAAKLVAVELKKAGIDITPQVCSLTDIFAGYLCDCNRTPSGHW